MPSRFLRLTLVALGLTVLSGGVVLVKLDNARLRPRVSDAQRRQAEVVRLRADNAQTRLLVTQAELSEEAAGQAIHTQVLSLRAEIERLEKQARAASAAANQHAVERAAMLENNRELRRGWVRLENMEQAGRGAPEDAVQTLIWSAFKGDDAVLQGVMTLSEANRLEAEGLLGALPIAARAEWTPERLAGLFFTGFFTEITAVSIETTIHSDPTHATVNLRVTNGAKERTIPVVAVATSGGWSVRPPEKAIAGMRRRLLPVDDPAPRK